MTSYQITSNTFYVVSQRPKTSIIVEPYLIRTKLKGNSFLQPKKKKSVKKRDNEIITPLVFDGNTSNNILGNLATTDKRVRTAIESAPPPLQQEQNGPKPAHLQSQNITNPVVQQSLTSTPAPSVTSVQKENTLPLTSMNLSKLNNSEIFESTTDDNMSTYMSEKGSASIFSDTSSVWPV